MQGTGLATQCTVGVILTGIGAGALAGVAGPLVDYAYPIVWWGVLLLMDAWNTHRHGLSLWRPNARHFALVTLPLSVLVWLYFEALNIPAPQWKYHSRIRDPLQLVPMGFASFSTVIPIVVECWWLVAGRQNVPVWPLQWLAGHKALSVSGAILLTAVPLFNDVFWFNQGMWLAPALALIPFTAMKHVSSGAGSLKHLTAAGLLSGVLWEAFNFPSVTGWHYIILQDVPHLFQMPIPGYAGFVPFAISILVVYKWSLRLSPGMFSTLILYAAGFAGLYALTIVYQQRGLWVFR